MILKFADGQTLVVKQAEEHFLTDEKYVTLNIYSSDFSRNIVGIYELLTTENIAKIQAIKEEDGKIIDTFTSYTQIISIRRSITEFDAGYHIILGDTNYKKEMN